MPKPKTLPVGNLRLDKRNFRIVPQKSELAVVRAIIATNPDWFWALMESLLDDGYHPTENIIVLEDGKTRTVKEGNRRIAAMKLILKKLGNHDIEIPASIEQRIDGLSPKWKSTNSKLPCLVYPKSEQQTVDRLITLTHGKGERAGRAKWEAVARARHNRDVNQAMEAGLDLLEAYLHAGKNLTNMQRERWGGDYPITVLDEAIKKISPRVGFPATRDLVAAYPKVPKHRSKIESVIYDIGLRVLDFKQLRDSTTDVLLTKYGIPDTSSSGSGSTGVATKTSSGGATAANTSAGTTSAGSAATSSKARAVASDDPRAIVRKLRDFQPVGKNREKVVSLTVEARKLNLTKTPLAFCFVLRSMFEISAKAYCKDHASSGGPSATKSGGEDRNLGDILRDITTHLTKNKQDKDMTKALHGAIAELAQQSSILSVTSMNQLVHNPNFVLKESHIASVFFNIFPLLNAMNS